VQRAGRPSAARTRTNKQSKEQAETPSSPQGQEWQSKDGITGPTKEASPAVQANISAAKYKVTVSSLQIVDYRIVSAETLPILSSN